MDLSGENNEKIMHQFHALSFEDFPNDNCGVNAMTFVKHEIRGHHRAVNGGESL